MTAAAPIGDLTYSSPRGRWVLASTVLGSAIAFLDATVVGIAIPRIGTDFHAGVSSLQWIVTGYTLTLSAFLLIGGTLGDRFGRRRIFMAGVAWFAIASLGCAVAPNIGTLIAARMVQGVGAALLTPGSLAILQASFVPADRSRAIGAWSGLGGLAAAAGPLVGGYLLAVASWRWIFVINLPLTAAVVVIAARHVPESSDPNAPDEIDVPGAVLAVIWLASLTFTLIEAASLGWSASVIAAAVIAVVGLVAFLVVEIRRSDPMLPLGIFRSRQFSATNAVTFIVYGSLSGSLFLLPIQLQQVNHYSPLEAGISLLPATLLLLVLSPRSGALASRIGPRLQMSIGPVIAGIGQILLARTAHDSNYLTGVLPGVFLFGLGMSITVAPLTSTAMSSVPAQHAGLASAVNNDVARFAGLVAVALLPALAGLTGSAYLDPAVFSAGFRTAVIITGLTCIAGGLLAAVTITDAGFRPGAEPPVRVVADPRGVGMAGCGIADTDSAGPGARRPPAGTAEPSA
jgi:EmrB/QacA subfamily drug resistance transporter